MYVFQHRNGSLTTGIDADPQGQAEFHIHSTHTIGIETQAHEAEVIAWREMTDVEARIYVNRATLPVLLPGPVTVEGERGIAHEISDDHGWVRVEFPARERFADGGWCDPATVEFVA